MLPVLITIICIAFIFTFLMLFYFKYFSNIIHMQSSSQKTVKYNLVSVYMCACLSPCNHKPDEDTVHFQQPRRLPFAPS